MGAKRAQMQRFIASLDAGATPQDAIRTVVQQNIASERVMETFMQSNVAIMLPLIARVSA